MAYQHRPGGFIASGIGIQPGDKPLWVVECPDMVRVGEGEAGEGDVMEHLGRIEAMATRFFWVRPLIGLLHRWAGRIALPPMLTMVLGAETLTVQAVHHGLYRAIHASIPSSRKGRSLRR